MQKPAKEEVQAILTKVKEVRRFAEDLMKDVRGSVSVKNMENLVNRYEEVRNWISRYSSEVGLQMPHIDDSAFYLQSSTPTITSTFSRRILKEFLEKGDMEVVVRDLIIGCKTAESYLESILRPLAEPEVLNKLNSLKKELEELEEKGLDLSVAKNLREAIDEAEQGHHLASAMISSRVICYLVDRIQGRDDKEKVDYLIRRGIIPKDRKDDQEKVITLMRRSRNFLSHDINIFSGPGDVLMLLGGAFNLVNLTLPLEAQKDPNLSQQPTSEG